MSVGNQILHKADGFHVYVQIQDGTEYCGKFSTVTEAVVEYKKAHDVLNGNKNPSIPMPHATDQKVVSDFMKKPPPSFLSGILQEIGAEFTKACLDHGSFNSPNEGYAVVLEKLDELWEEVRKKKADRDPGQMKLDAVQIAAMAIRFVNDIVEEKS